MSNLCLTSADITGILNVLISMAAFWSRFSRSLATTTAGSILGTTTAG